MKKNNAYWISPSGTIYEVPITHINYIINNAELFDLDLDEIKAIYKKHNEKLRFEGKARNEIIEDLLKKAWIRIRYRNKNHAWHINHCSESRSLVNRLKKWYEQEKISIDSPSFKMLKIHRDAVNYDHDKVQEFLYDPNFIKNCLNCQHSTWAVGVGQGFFCTNEDKIKSSEVNTEMKVGRVHISSTGFKRFFIPNREYKCEFHEYRKECRF